MNEKPRTTLLPASILLAIVLLIGFGLSLPHTPPGEPGWWQRGLLSAAVLIVALLIVAVVCAWLGNALKFSKRINGAIVMAVGFVLLRLSFHAAGLSDEDIFRSLGSAVLTGALLGAILAPRFEQFPNRLRNHPNAGPVDEQSEETNL